MFKIFYSWQSDLPGNKTRNFIRECIDEAIDLAQESEAMEAERDEATMGITGSPDIVSTLFSKIEDCDLFIADISLCFTGDEKTDKKSPNPNVMLELGYALSILGPERVICLCNTDFGKDYPFDIAHNRINGFSLEGQSKKEIKSDISRIIFMNIRDLKKQAPRAKANVASHIVGSYDLKRREVTSVLVPIEIGTSESFTLHNEELITEARTLLYEIDALNKQKPEPKSIREKSDIQTINQDAGIEDADKRELIKAIAESYKLSESSVAWKGKEEDKERIMRWLGITVSDEFFDLGDLKQTVQLLNQGTVYHGTDDEMAKHEKLQEISYKLLLLDVRTNYIKTFEGMSYVPLAIQNISTVQDSDIRIVIHVIEGEVVNPNENLIWKEYEGIQGTLCRDDDDENDIGVIAELFIPNEDGNVHFEEELFSDLPYVPSLPPMLRKEKDEEDYKQELEEFIAYSYDGYYEFNIRSLRPKECKWLPQGILMRPVDGSIKLKYQIHSAHSTGELEGELTLLE